jgi:hypothetical protein
MQAVSKGSEDADPTACQPQAGHQSLPQGKGLIAIYSFHACGCATEIDLVSTGLGRVEPLPWGMNIKTLDLLLPTVIRSKILPCSDVPMTGLKQRESS